MKPIRSLFRRNATEAAPDERGSLRNRIAVLLAVLAFPAMAAPGDFGALPGAAPVESESLSQELAAMPAMPFERPGMTFPGSAYFYLADPLEEGLIALPATDPTGSASDVGAKVGQLIDAGPAARPFFSAVGETSHSRALECLAQAVWYEAASEGDAGQRAVAQVVLNRVAHPAWPSSVCGVVYQGSQRSTGCQFSFTCDGSLSRRASGASWRRARTIASDALSGSVYAPIGHATHYHTLWVNPVWASSLDPIGTIGAHRFYRNRGATGTMDAFTAGYSGVEPGVSGRTRRISAQGSQDAALPAASPRIAYPQSDAPAIARTLDPATPTMPAPNSGFGNAGQVKREFAQAGQWKQPRQPDDAPTTEVVDSPPDTH